jgi:hypothetical protein
MLKNAESRENPVLLTPTTAAADEEMKRRLDTLARKEEGVHEDALQKRSPTIVKMSSAEWYKEAGECMKRLQRRKNLGIKE